jgi:hypothetical protein
MIRCGRDDSVDKFYKEWEGFPRFILVVSVLCVLGFCFQKERIPCR